MIITTAGNAGDGEVDGETQTVTLSDTLPAGVEVTNVHSRRAGTPLGVKEANVGFTCTKAPVNPVVCTFKKTLPPFEQIEILIKSKPTSRNRPNPKTKPP